MTVIVVAGPTGTGKSELALRLAEALSGEVVNYDSIQMYRGFDIGSAKPSVAMQQRVPHHLFDVAAPDEEVTAADYARMASAVCAEIQSRCLLPILAGGTFFYLRALLSGLPDMPARDPAVRARLRDIAQRPRGQARLHRWLSRVDPPSGEKIAMPDRHRVERALEVWHLTGQPISSWIRPATGVIEEMPSVKIALTVERKALIEMLDRRVQKMYAEGLIVETARLLENYPPTARPFSGIGYREAVAVLNSGMSEIDAIAETKRRTRAYAKRQMTWLRSERNVHWLDATNKDATLAAAMRLIEDLR